MISGRRMFLFLSALVWLPYGVFCFFEPEYLAQAAGVVGTSETGVIELRAMYGGLQAALGVLLLLGAFLPTCERHALVALALLCAGLGLSRAAGTLFAADVSAYTAFAIAFEWTSTGIATWLLRRPKGTLVTAPRA